MGAVEEVLLPAGVGRGGIFARPHRAVTVGMISVIFLVAFEAYSVGTAMPVAVRALNGLPYYAFAFSGFLTTSLFGMVVAGERSDRVGPRAPLLGGVGCFGAGLVTAGTATTMPQLLVGRCVQGLGAGMIIVSVYVLIARVYPQELRPRAFSLLAASWVVPSMVGPVIAGAVAEHLSWRWVFLGVAVLIVAPTLTLLGPLSHLPDATDPPDPRPNRRKAALATALGAGILQYAADELHWISLPFALLALVLLIPSVPKLLPAGTLRARRGLPTVILMRGFMAGAYFGVEAFIPVMLVEERKLSPTLAGLSLTGAAISWAIASWMQSRSAYPLSRQTTVRLGAAVTGVALIGPILAVSSHVPAWTAAAAVFFAAFGMGLSLPSISVLTLELSAPTDQGANSAALQLCDGLGSITFIGAGGAIMHALYTDPGHGGHVFVLIFTLMLAVAVVANFVAPRVSVGGAR